MSAVTQMDQFSKTQQIDFPLVQEGTLTFQYLFFILKIFLILSILFWFLKRKKRDLKKEQIRESNNVPKNKIIVALQIKDLLIHLQNRPKPGYEIIQQKNSEANIIWKSFSNILGYKLSFKTLFNLRQINNFIRSLKNIQNVQLMIYTSLNPQITDSLLKKLKLSEIFAPQNRKFCNSKQADMLKHAIDVDKQSRRVIIVTPCKSDHSWQDEKYFLVLNPKGGRNRSFLKNCLRIIKDLLQNNESMDTLHDQLGQLKIDVQQSDLSDGYI